MTKKPRKKKGKKKAVKALRTDESASAAANVACTTAVAPHDLIRASFAQASSDAGFATIEDIGGKEPDVALGKSISAKFVDAATDAGYATIDELFAALETNADGRLSLREFVAGARACAMSATTVTDVELIDLFGVIDAEHGIVGTASDGQLSSAEFVSFIRSHAGGAPPLATAAEGTAAPRVGTVEDERTARAGAAKRLFELGLIAMDELAAVESKLALWGASRTPAKAKALAALGAKDSVSGKALTTSGKKRTLKRRGGQQKMDAEATAAAARKALEAQRNAEVDKLLRQRRDAARAESDAAFTPGAAAVFKTKAVGTWTPEVVEAAQVFESIAHKITPAQLEAALGDTPPLWRSEGRRARGVSAGHSQSLGAPSPRPTTPRALRAEAERIRAEGAPPVPSPTRSGSAERVAAKKLRTFADDLTMAALTVEPLHMTCSSLRALASDAKRAATAGDVVGETLTSVCVHLTEAVPLIAALADPTPSLDRLAEMDREQAKLDAEILATRRRTDAVAAAAAAAAAKRPKSLPPAAVLAGPEEDHHLGPEIREAFLRASVDAGFATVDDLFAKFDTHGGQGGDGTLSLKEFVAGARSCGLSATTVSDDALVGLFGFIDAQHGGAHKSDGQLSVAEFLYFIHGDDLPSSATASTGGAGAGVTCAPPSVDDLIRTSFLKASNDAGFTSAEDLFKNFDRANGDGDLSLREFVAGARSSGLSMQTVGDDQLVEMFQHVDAEHGNGDGRINIGEFTAWLRVADAAEAPQATLPGASRKVFPQLETEIGFGAPKNLEVLALVEERFQQSEARSLLLSQVRSRHSGSRPTGRTLPFTHPLTRARTLSGARQHGVSVSFARSAAPRRGRVRSRRTQLRSKESARWYRRHNRDPSAEQYRVAHCEQRGARTGSPPPARAADARGRTRCAGRADPHRACGVRGSQRTDPYDRAPAAHCGRAARCVARGQERGRARC
jgi:Ca2+-binding EF-hand superfamily protein